jgi:hypothetical protein
MLIWQWAAQIVHHVMAAFYQLDVPCCQPLVDAYFVHGRPVFSQWQENVFAGTQVPRLQGVVRDRRANWLQSLATLRAAKEAGARVTKTSIMLGCGETPAEVVAAMQELRNTGAYLFVWSPVQYGLVVVISRVAGCTCL